MLKIFKLGQCQFQGFLVNNKHIKTLKDEGAKNNGHDSLGKWPNLQILNTILWSNIVLEVVELDFHKIIKCWTLMFT